MYVYEYISYMDPMGVSNTLGFATWMWSEGVPQFSGFWPVTVSAETLIFWFVLGDPYKGLKGNWG